MGSTETKYFPVHIDYNTTIKIKKGKHKLWREEKMKAFVMYKKATGGMTRIKDKFISCFKVHPSCCFCKACLVDVPMMTDEKKNNNNLIGSQNPLSKK